ncbi:MAG: thioredoxin family protein [Syntrophothermus sp.]
MAHKFFEEKRPQTGLTYEEYSNAFLSYTQTKNNNFSSDAEKELFDYVKLNYQRSSRIDKNYKILDEVRKNIESIDEPQIWMLITENWCGDSAQNLPYIAKIAAINPLIDFRIILRDSNEDIMDMYLTNGTRSIPKLIVFDLEGNEIFQWGPRPAEAQKVILEAKAENLLKKEMYERLHLWYGRDNGKQLEKEIVQKVIEHTEKII